MSTRSNAPIIIKRKKVIQGGHHGGAWKVAYADFVTAMMAFFLLMWLLGATNEKQRKGIADYFNPTIPVNRISGGGEGVFGGDSIFSENTLSKNGTGSGTLQQVEVASARGETGFLEEQGAAEYQAFSNMIEELSGRGGESMVSDLLQRHVVSRLSDEGLIVEIFDVPGQPLFLRDGAASQTLLTVLDGISEVFRLSPNEIAVEGHLASQPPDMPQDIVWSVSAARANAVRVVLEELMARDDRVRRVTGHGDREPVTKDPRSDRNNRIEVILLRDRF